MWWADIEVPNTAVAMDAWAVSACYPQSTFYPMSNGDTTFHRWITRSYFRNCSTCQSYSKAHLCPYALTHDCQPCWMYLRTPPLLFGRKPPQSNWPPDTVPDPDDGIRLDARSFKSGISLVASTIPDETVSKASTYATHKEANTNIRLQ